MITRGEGEGVLGEFVVVDAVVVDVDMVVVEEVLTERVCLWRGFGARSNVLWRNSFGL